MKISKEEFENLSKLASLSFDSSKENIAQDLEKIFFRINFGVVIITKSDLLKYKNIMTPKRLKNTPFHVHFHVQ